MWPQQLVTKCKTQFLYYFACLYKWIPHFMLLTFTLHYNTLWQNGTYENSLTTTSGNYSHTIGQSLIQSNNKHEMYLQELLVPYEWYVRSFLCFLFSCFQN